MVSYKKLEEQRRLQNSKTGWAIEPESKLSDSSIDDCVKGPDTVKTGVVERPVGEQYTDSELVRTYRKAKGITTGIYRRYTQVFVAAASTLACAALIVYAGHKTDWFYLAKEEPVVPDAGAYIGKDSDCDGDVDRSDWVNPFWDKIYGEDDDEPVKKVKPRSKDRKKRRKNKKFRE